MSKSLFDEVARERFLDLMHDGVDGELAASMAVTQAVVFMTAYEKKMNTVGKLNEVGGTRDCQACFGSGGKKNSPCQVCNGTGKVPA